MKNKLISVIIPVYKVEKYLPQTLESITNQKYQNLEIILIDDGSPDNSGKICDEYARTDSRIKVIHKENGGVASARNKGLEAANGEYIMFLDSDDLFCDNIFETIIKNLTDDIDIYTYLYKKIDDDGNDLSFENVNVFEEGIYEKLEFLKKYYKKINGFPWNIWQNVFKTSIIRKNNICFMSGKKVAEDVDFYITYMSYVKNVMYCNYPILKYRVGRPGSAMTNMKVESVMDVLEIYSKHSNSKQPFVSKIFAKFYIGALLYIDRIEKDEDKEKIISLVDSEIVMRAPGIKAFLFKVLYFFFGKEKTINLLIKLKKGR